MDRQEWVGKRVYWKHEGDTGVVERICNCGFNCKVVFVRFDISGSIKEVRTIHLTMIGEEKKREKVKSLPLPG